ncbi:MAG: hypothetical protein HYS05_06940 [Acidobacteria bacterium]|nr:hypothetical protein [Acidobacteriota bacterium]
MSDEYLWDRSGDPDPEVAALEQLLGQLGHRAAPGTWPAPAPKRRWPAYVAYGAVAASIALMIGATFLTTRVAHPTWQVVSVAGTPRVGAADVGTEGTIRVGEWLETDASSRARIDVGLVGQVQVGPNSRIGLLKTQPTEHRLSLARGTIEARIWAPPGLFFVETRSAVAIDLGCVYSLEMDEGGEGLLRVKTGFVGFEYGGRESFVPQGAACATRPDLGPGTPYYEDANAAFHAALERVDTLSAGSSGHADALTTVLAEARKADALTLWHLLSRVETADRARVFDRLAALVPPPPTVTRDGIVQLDRPMLDLWWDALGLGNTTFWRAWKGSYPLSKPR